VRIGVVGLDYVGPVTVAFLSGETNSVLGIDVDVLKIQMLRSGKLLIFESGLDERIKSAGNNPEFSSDHSKQSKREEVFLCVPTPNVGCKIDLKYVLSAANVVKKYDTLSDLMIKSNVLPGTARKVSELTGINVFSNPEFTREGSTIRDTENSDRIVIARKFVWNVETISESSGFPVVVTTNVNAELIKYASNAFLAVKISFINQIADVCEKILNTDVNKVAEGMGMDRGIGREFLKTGISYRGLYFPKDAVAISSFSEEKEVDLIIVMSAIYYNERRLAAPVNKIKVNFDTLNGRGICVLGRSFKDNTYDLRESRSLLLIKNLKSRWVIVNAYDLAVKAVKGVTISSHIVECITPSKIVITSTEWKDFSNLDPEPLNERKVFGLGRVFDPENTNIAMVV
jgi:UDPglucose 6-dehydrogenase